MLQQINFYPLLPKPARYKITPALSLHICIGFAALLLTIYLFNIIIYFWQHYQLAHLELVQQSAQQQLNKLNEQYANNTQNKPLSWQNQQLAAELSSKQNTLAKIKQTAPADQQGYSKYFLSFAATIVPEVWLTNIHIKAVDRQIDLTGSATNSTAVMQFIQNMGKNVVFNHKTFNVLRLENSPDNSQVINFNLSTTAREQNANPDRKTP